MFSLLHGTVAPHFGHVTTFPSSLEVSKDFLSPNPIGEGNIALQFMHTTNACAI